MVSGYCSWYLAHVAYKSMVPLDMVFKSTYFQQVLVHGIVTHVAKKVHGIWTHGRWIFDASKSMVPDYLYNGKKSMVSRL
jgi:hypothetical protein